MKLLGFSIESVPHLKLAAWAGIGQAHRIEERGASLDRLQRQYRVAPSI
jgi:hypothetical protein